MKEEDGHYKVPISIGETEETVKIRILHPFLSVENFRALCHIDFMFKNHKSRLEEATGRKGWDVFQECWLDSIESVERWMESALGSGEESIPKRARSEPLEQPVPQKPSRYQAQLSQYSMWEEYFVQREAELKEELREEYEGEISDLKSKNRKIRGRVRELEEELKNK